MTLDIRPRPLRRSADWLSQDAAAGGRLTSEILLKSEIRSQTEEKAAHPIYVFLHRERRPLLHGSSSEMVCRTSALTKGVKKDEDEEETRGRKEQRGQKSGLLFRSSVFPWKGSVWKVMISSAEGQTNQRRQKSTGSPPTTHPEDKTSWLKG